MHFLPTESLWKPLGQEHIPEVQMEPDMPLEQSKSSSHSVRISSGKVMLHSKRKKQQTATTTKIHKIFLASN